MFQPRHSSSSVRNKYNKLDPATMGGGLQFSSTNRSPDLHKADMSIRSQHNPSLNLYNSSSSGYTALKLDKLPNLEQLRKSCIYDIDTLVFCLYGLELQKDNALASNTTITTSNGSSPDRIPFRFEKFPDGKRMVQPPPRRGKQLVQFNFASSLPSPSLVTAPSEFSNPPEVESIHFPPTACDVSEDGPLRGSEKAVRGPVPSLKSPPSQQIDEKKEEVEVSFLQRVLGKDLEEDENMAVPLSSIPRPGGNELSWQYKDPSGGIQGPFTSRQMFEWWENNFFPPKLLVRYNVNMPWTSYRVLYPEPMTPFLNPPQRIPFKSSSSSEVLNITKQMRMLLSSIDPTVKNHTQPEIQPSQIGWVTGKPKAEPLAEIMARQADEANNNSNVPRESTSKVEQRVDGAWSGSWARAIGESVWSSGVHDNKNPSVRRTQSDNKSAWDIPRSNGMPLSNWIKEDRLDKSGPPTPPSDGGSILELNRIMDEWQIKIDPCLLGILFSLKSEANILIFLKHAAKGSTERHAAFAAYLNHLRERYPAEWAQMLQETTLKSSKASLRNSGRSRSNVWPFGDQSTLDSSGRSGNHGLK